MPANTLSVFNLATGMIKDLTRYPGQMGVPGADFDAGIRLASRSRVYYVDKTNPRANDSNDGTNPWRPKLTIQSAITAHNALINWGDAFGGLLPFSTIYVGPGVYAENLTPAYFCRIIGLGQMGTDTGTEVHPATGSALAGTGLGLHLYNIWFESETAVPVIDFGICNNTIIENCNIVRGIAGLATFGLQTDNATHLQVLNCLFGSGVANFPTAMQFLGGADRYLHQSFIHNNRIFAVTTGIDIPANCTATGTVIQQNVIAGPPATGIQDLNGNTICVDNWITATDAINHATAANCIANHVIDAGVGAVELTGTD